MFGYLRFLLAYTVMLSHIGIRINGLNPGVIAVVIFYLLAGYVVSYLYRDLFAGRKDRLRHFYLDRIKRIFPLYLYVVVLTLLFLLLTAFGKPLYAPDRIIENLLVIPLNYYMYVDSTILQDPKWCLVPPAWSLGAELQAYILLPFTLVSAKWRVVLLVLTYGIYLLANFSVLHPDYYGYRLLAGVFFIFLLGAAIQRDRKEDRYLLLGFFVVTSMVFVVLLQDGSWAKVYTWETTLGIFFGLPLIYLISKIEYRLPFNTLLGAFSYAFFLLHFLSLWVLEYAGYTPSFTLAYIAAVTILTLLFSAIGVFIVENRVRRGKA